MSELVWICIFAAQSWQAKQPSPPAAPAELPVALPKAAATVPDLRPAGEHPDFTGVWKQTESEGMDAFLKCIGIGYLKRSLAAKAMPKITQVIEHEGDVITIATKGGLKGDQPPITNTVGLLQEVENDNITAMVTPTWEDGGHMASD